MSHIVSAHHAPGVHRKRHLTDFWRHFLEMLAAMAVGMIATIAVFVSVVGLKTWDQVTVQYPTQALLAMAAGMTIPMVAWMLFRGMGRTNCAVTIAAMLGLMFYRRSQYSATRRPRAGAASRLA